MNIRMLLVSVIIASVTIPLFAHNAWVAKDSTGYHVLYGHEKIAGYDPAKVKEVLAFDVKGNKLPVKTIAADSGVALKISSQPSCFLSIFDNGFYTKTTDGSKNISKKGIKDYISASHSVKYTKSIFAWNPIFLKPMGQKIEIVPATNPALLKESDSLGVTVFFEGKPLSGAPLSIAGTHDPVDTTDAQGVAKVKLPATGQKLIVASLKIPLKDDPDTDTLSISGAVYLDLKK